MSFTAIIDFFFFRNNLLKIRLKTGIPQVKRIAVPGALPQNKTLLVNISYFRLLGEIQHFLQAAFA